jgi:hypothetical protein
MIMRRMVEGKAERAKRKSRRFRTGPSTAFCHSVLPAKAGIPAG